MGLSLAALLTLPASSVRGAVAPDVLIVVAFDDSTRPPSEEARPWYSEEGLRTSVETSNGETLRCNSGRSVCLYITGVGKINAAIKMLALGLDPRIDLRKTYIIESGIGGASPHMATVGTSAWAHWVVDFDMAHEVDARELTAPFTFSRFRLGCTSSNWCEQGWTEGTEVYELNPSTVNWAFAVTKNVRLTDTPGLKAYRSSYTYAEARAGPRVISCDVIAGDTFWIGNWLGAFSDWWTRKWTNGAGKYCMNSMEDTALAAAITQLSKLGRANFRHFLILRTASDFDRQHPKQAAASALAAGENDAFYRAAAENGYLTARTLERYIVAHWDRLSR